MRGDERCLSLCPAFAGRDCHPVRVPGPPVAPAKAGAVSEVILPMTPAVEFLSVSRHFGTVKAVDRVDLTIAEGSFFAMLGPSGSGKTTCLRLISGFEMPTAGTVRIFGQDMGSVPPNRRQVNTVFQDYALFPHMSVRDNVAYGLMVKGIDRRTRLAKAEELLALVKLDGFGARRPDRKSVV